MSRKNNGAAPALHPCPAVAVGAMADGKPARTLAAHRHGAAPDEWFSRLAVEVAGEETGTTVRGCA